MSTPHDLQDALPSMELLSPALSYHLAYVCCGKLPNAILYLSPSLHVAYANPAAKRLFLHVAPNLLHLSATVLFPGLTEQDWLTLGAQARLAGSQTRLFDLPAQAEYDRAEAVVLAEERDGRIFFILILQAAPPLAVAPPPRESGPLRLLTRRAERRFQALYAHLPILLQSCDKQQRLLDANRCWLDTLGYAREHVVGTCWLDLLDAPSLATVQETIQPRLLSGEPVRDVPLRLRRADGTWLDVLYAAVPVEADGHDETLACLTDITLQKQTERELERNIQIAEAANEAKSAFLAHMSHELRTPLNAVLGYAQILGQSGLNPEQQRGVQIIHRSGEHLLTLINDVLDLSRIEVGKLDIQLSDFDLAELLRHVVDITRIKARQKSLMLSVKLASDLPRYIRGDSRRLRQILLNILNNGIKFTERGGIHLAVVPAEHGNDIHFVIQDTGVGIPSDRLDEIFRPFQQAHEHNAQLSQQGAGLGLSITKHLTELMGGSIHVKSQPGAGSTFTVVLPLAASDRSTPIRGLQRRIGYEGPARRVLIVDDRWENRSILYNMLEPLGFELSEASNGIEALQVASSFRPEIVLMDLVMPEMDGFEAVRRLRLDPVYDNTRVVALSASAFERDRAQSLGAGCDDFLPKPVQLEELLDILAEQLHLTWRTTDAAASLQLNQVAGPSRDAQDPLPPAEALEDLRLNAKQGRIMRVRKELAHLRQRFPESETLWERLERLTFTFQMQEICDLLSALYQTTDS